MRNVYVYVPYLSSAPNAKVFLEADLIAFHLRAQPSAFRWYGGEQPLGLTTRDALWDLMV